MGFSLRHVEPQYFSVNERSEVWRSDLNFESGQSTLVTAASGKGKSSLFRFLTGFNDSFSGDISFNGKLIKSFKTDELCSFRKNDWSLIFQSLALFPYISAEENIRLSSGGNLNEIAVEALGMRNLLQNETSTLSYGERQRIAIIRALSRSYGFLIMDEPFSHLDNKLREIAWNLMQSDCTEKNAGLILLDLHPQSFIKTDRILKL